MNRSLRRKNLIVILGEGPSPPHGGGDELGDYGGRLRVIAGALMHSKNPESVIFASGGMTRLCAGKNFIISRVMKKELVRLGVPKEGVFEDRFSGNTFEQLLELEKFLSRRRFRRSVIVSNKYHLPRIRAMLNCFRELEALRKAQISLKSAESILLKADPDWQARIQELYQKPEMAEITAQEKRGVREIKAGKYRKHRRG